MPFSLVPDQVYSSVLEVDPKALAAAGIRLLLADLDNTLVRYGETRPEEAVQAWNRALSDAGVTLFLLSNSRKPGRAAKLAAALDVSYEGHAGKPKRGGFVRAMERMGCVPSQTAMVGDQIFTDILGAKRAGIRALLVKPMELKGNPGRYVRYAAESPFRALGRRKRS